MSSEDLPPQTDEPNEVTDQKEKSPSPQKTDEKQPEEKTVNNEPVDEGSKEPAAVQPRASSAGAATIEPEVPPGAGEILIKHPLMYTWVLWYCKSEKNKNWEDCLKQVAEFDTVEDFWAMYNHIQLASGLPNSSDYYLFKKGIMPMWEDEQNKEGGRWLIQIDRQQRAETLDVYWLEMLMAMIGEQFDDGSDNVCGAVVNVRAKGDKISLWTRDCCNEECNKKIGLILKQKLGLQATITYEMHKDTSQKTGSMVRAQLRV